MSRYMNRIIEINPEEGWVRVEAGVIKDQLNQFLKPYGYFFAPELSTSNRATLGGMINTDASGQGSLVYGKTSDHVMGVRAVLLGAIFSIPSRCRSNWLKRWQKRAPPADGFIAPCWSAAAKIAN